MTNTHAQPLPIITTPQVSEALTSSRYGVAATTDYQLDQALSNRRRHLLEIVIDDLLTSSIRMARQGDIFNAQYATRDADRLVREFGAQA